MIEQEEKQHRPSAEVKIELDNWILVKVKLVAQIESYEKKIVECREQIRMLEGSHCFRGLIEKTRQELFESEIHEKDLVATPIVFKPNGVWGSSGFVLHKVTAKRIYIRRRGNNRTEQCYLNGRPVSYGDCIDFEVTSNRPDCLGHLGVAREASVLYQKPPLCEVTFLLFFLTSVFFSPTDSSGWNRSFTPVQRAFPFGFKNTMK